MPTSKFPGILADVPDVVSKFARSQPGIHCNARLSEWFKDWDGNGKRTSSSHVMADTLPINSFLDSIRGKRVVLHFQGYRAELGTAVIQITNVLWTTDFVTPMGSEPAYPRLDFKHPDGMNEVNGCPNLWGAFILAIAEVNPTTEIGAWPDELSERFMDIVTKFGVREA